jgi:hypothetical protein
MPVVTGNPFELEISNAPHTPQYSYVDLASLLSKHYGKTVKQGNNFVICGAQVSLIPKDTLTDFDAGMAVSSKFEYCPTTRHTRKAWNETHSMWSRQKALRAGIGSAVHFDEMEFAFNTAHSYGRASSLRQGGLQDSDDDTMSIFGSSSESSNDFALEDYYNSQHPVTSESRYSYDNSVIKDRKFEQYFPDAHSFYTTSQLSAAVAEAGEAPAVYLSAAAASNDMTVLPNLNVFCGMMRVANYVITDDTATQVQDLCYAQISIHVVKWTSLFTKPKSYNRRGKASRRSSSYKKTYPRSSWKGKRYARRRK